PTPTPHTSSPSLHDALPIFLQHSHDLILGADTIVVIENEILGKPRDQQDAARMLQLLSGRTHQVITGVCLLGRDPRTENRELGTDFEDTRSELTNVT